MWVQEGNDCKQSEAPSPGLKSLYSSLYSISRSKPKQSVTRIGIPMKSQIQKNVDSVGSSALPSAATEHEQKDREFSPAPRVRSLNDISNKVPPISPAEFLDNIRNDVSKSKSGLRDDSKIASEVSCFSDQDEESGDEDQTLFCDLSIMGTKLKLSPMKLGFDVTTPTTSQLRKNLYKEASMEMKIVSPLFKSTRNVKEPPSVALDDVPDRFFIPQKFSGLDIERASEWTQCVEFAGLLVVEVYSAIFGPSEVMYPFIDEILNKRQNESILFVRLRLSKLEQLDEIKQVLAPRNEYSSSPIPLYLFVQNGTKVDQLLGTQPSSFEKLVDQYLTDVRDKRSAQKTEDVAVTKYSSILTSKRPESARVSRVSFSSSTANNVKASISLPNELDQENIRNLIKKDTLTTWPFTTRLSKRSSRSTGC